MIVLTVWSLLVAQSNAAPTNSWSSLDSGFWDDSGAWTLGAPDISQWGVLITNAGDKTVTIDQLTVAFAPSTTIISNLVISGVGNTTNTLLLDDIGTNVPLRILNNATISSGGVLQLTNSLIVVGQLYFSSGASVEFSVGTNTIAAVVSNNLTVGGKLNIVDSGGFSNTTYTLFKYGGSLANNGLTIGSTPNPNYYACSIDTSTVGQVNLVVSITAPALPFGITSIVRQGDDIVLSWNTGGLSNVVQISSGVPGSGDYTNDFSNLATIFVTTPTTNYVDTGGALNSPSRFYRVRSMP
jgi:hypothetical protein